MEGESSVLGKRKAKEMEDDPERYPRTSHNDLMASAPLNLSLVKADDGENTISSSNSDDEDIERDHTEYSAEDSEDLLYNYDEDSEDFDEDDEGPPELEVKEQQHSIGESLNGQVTIKLWLQEDDDEFESWMQTIHVHCTYDGKIIGRGLGRHVNRNQIRSNFWQDMEEPCQELSLVAFEVFDRYGRLKQEFIDHPVRRGNGSWGSELDIGPLFIIEQICVDRSWRRKSIGNLMVNCLMGKSCAGGRNTAFTLVGPGWLNSDIREDIDGKTRREQREIQYRAHDVAVSFYRAIGFRRIGSSSCFGLAADLDHRAYKILSATDFDPPNVEEEEDDLETEGEVTSIPGDPFGVESKRQRRLVLLQSRLPLHHATLTLADNECVEFYKEFKKLKPSIEDWRKTDGSRQNVLQVAACELKVNSLQWLLSNMNESKVLSSARNVKGRTPLEELQSRLDFKRTTLDHGMLTICISDQFLGFADEAVKCLAALQIEGIPTRIHLNQLKYGCTCGECIDGFLSPRMKFALICQAEIGYDMLWEYIDDAELWCSMQDHMINHVAPDIQQNFLTNKSLRQGFASVFSHAATALRENTSPTVKNILDAWRNSSEWPPITRNFF